MSDPPLDKVALDPTVDFVAGTIGGIAGLVFGFPFDTLKVRFQTPETAGRYHSITHAVSTIVKEERFIGLYKGITSPLATVALMNGLVFSSYGFLLRLQTNISDSPSTLTQVALAGTGCGIISSIITTPTELIKIRQQALLTQTTARQITREIIQQHGLKGLYRGMAVTAFRDCGYGGYFFAYEATSRYLTPMCPQWISLLAAGGIAGMVGWIVTFPLDVVKTRVQGSSLSPNDFSTNKGHGPGTALLYPATPVTANPYRTALSTTMHSYQTEGLGVFYRGLAPTLIRAIPVNMATFAVFEAVVHVLSLDK